MVKGCRMEGLTSIIFSHQSILQQFMTVLGLGECEEFHLIMSRSDKKSSDGRDTA